MNERMRAICTTPGIPGFEDAIQDVVARLLTPHVDELWRDRMGNLIAVKRARPEAGATPRRLVYAAHVDEIGMMVSHVDAAGFVRFRAVGGLDPRALPSQRVIVHASQGDRRTLHGVIATQSGWLGTPEDRQRVFPIDELYVDLGRTGADVAARVVMGDPITFAAELDDLNDDVLVGRNFDDRIGVYCLIEAMRRLERVDVDVYAVASVQEEVGVRGMPTAAHAIAADLAVAIDGALPSDTPYARAEQRQCLLGHGTGIYLMDNRTIGTPRLVRGLIDTCLRHGIPFQRNLGGGTDASEIQRHGLGAWATTIGAPTRYMHSTVQLVHRADVEATIALLVAFAGDAAGIIPADWR